MLDKKQQYQIISIMKKIFSQNFYRFCRDKLPKEVQNNQKTPSDFNFINNIIEIQRTQKRFLQQQEIKQRSLSKILNYYSDNEIQFKLYMRQDYVNSQYIFALMNFNKLGFKKISNLAYLDYLTYGQKQKLKHLKDEERWPTLLVTYSIEPLRVLVGEKQIFQWMRSNHFFKPFDQESTWIPQSIEYIKNEIQKPLDAMFWHPVLVAQYSFDGNAESYRKQQKTYILIAVIRMNFQLIAGRMIKGIYKILRHRQYYQKSKQNFEKSLYQLMKLVQKDGFMGGKQPNQCDFYLYSLLCTKLNSRFFQKYVQQKLSRDFNLWLRRMNAICKFDRDRLTIL